MKALAIPEDFLVPTCTRCKLEIFDAETSAKLAPILLEKYRLALRKRVRRAIEILREYTSQRRLVLFLGLSQGDLSRLHAGAGNPSPELVSNLALLAKDPMRRLTELERYWAEPYAEIDSPPCASPQPQERT